jgi:tetratricopeptide (TPR) repeat protein
MFRKTDVKLVLLLLIGMASFAGMTPSANAIQTDDKFESYLKSHELTDLLIEYYERELATQTAANQRKILAGKLIDRYVAELTHSAAADNDRALVRLNELVLLHPDLSNTEIRITLTRFKFLNRQIELGNLLVSGKSEIPKTQLRDDFAEFVTIYKTTGQQLENEINLLAESTTRQLSSEGKSRSQLESQLSEVMFYRAWCEYYSALLADSPSVINDYITQSDRLFRDFLGLSQEVGLEKIEQEWVDLESPIICRAIAGLAMVHTFRDDRRQRDACFDMLSSPRVPQEISSLLPLWKFQAAVFAANHQRAAELATEYASQVEPLQQVIEYWIQAVRVGVKLKPDNPTVSAQLVELAIIGSLQLGQFAALEKSIQQGTIDTSGFGAYGQWATADRQFRAAEADASNPELYVSVIRLAQDACDQLEKAKAPVLDQARCINLAAWSHYRLRRWQLAADQFRVVYQSLKTLDPALADDALWMRIESLKNIRNLGERFESQWLAALDEYQRVFSHTQRAAHARFEFTRNQATDRSELEVMQQLKKTPEDDPNYAASQLEIARLHYQMWEKATSESSQSQALFSLSEHIDQLLDRSVVSAETRLKSAFLLNDCYIRAGNIEASEKLLQRVEPLLAGLEKNSTSRVEFAYQQMQLAKQKNDLPAAEKYANDIVNIDANSAFARTAYTFLANQADQKLSRAIDSNRAERLRDAIKIYEKLSALFGQTQQEITQSKNARIVLAKLATYRKQNGQTDEALRLYQVLLAAYPQSKSYLLESARLLTDSGQHTKAIELWNSLVSGTDSDDEIWFEAKYNQMLCLEKTDPKTAIQVLHQFKRLHPKPPGKWNELVDQLQERLQQ